MPTALQQEPELADDLYVVYEDYARLSASRGMNGGIPFDSIDRYAARYGPHSMDEFDRWYQLIRAIDAAVQEHKK